MRALSALVGSISILLIFVVVRELYWVVADSNGTAGEMAAGFAALLFATNIALVQSSRTARMYPLMTAAELAQVLFFIRAHRDNVALNSSLSAVFLAIAIAMNFIAVFLLVSEAFWVSYLLVAKWRQWPGAQLPLAGPALTLPAGLALLLPFAPAAGPASYTALRSGAFDWIKYQPPLGWFYDVLRNSTGNRSLFRLLLALAAFSIWRNRNRVVLAPMFITAAVVGPFASVVTLSLFGRSMMVDRYVLLALVAFLALAASGAAAFESKFGRTLVFLLIVWLSARAFKHSSAFWVDWKKAVAMAPTRSGNEEIGVVPAYAVNVVRYYLPPQRRSLAIGLDSECGRSHILILSAGPVIPRAFLSELDTCYPRLIGRATRVEVRSR
jgi:hypothetical protein